MCVGYAIVHTTAYTQSFTLRALVYMYLYVRPLVCKYLYVLQRSHCTAIHSVLCTAFTLNTLIPLHLKPSTVLQCSNCIHLLYSLYTHCIHLSQEDTIFEKYNYILNFFILRSYNNYFFKLCISNYDYFILVRSLPIYLKCLTICFHLTL